MALFKAYIREPMTNSTKIMSDDGFYRPVISSDFMATQITMSNEPPRLTRLNCSNSTDQFPKSFSLLQMTEPKSTTCSPQPVYPYSRMPGPFGVREAVHAICVWAARKSIQHNSNALRLDSSWSCIEIMCTENIFFSCLKKLHIITHSPWHEYHSYCMI